MLLSFCGDLRYLMDYCQLHHSRSLSFLLQRPPNTPLFPYTTLFRSTAARAPYPGRHPATFLKERAKRSQAGESAVETRSEEHTSELQSRFDIVCRLLLEKKNVSAASPSADRVIRSLSFPPFTSPIRT